MFEKKPKKAKASDLGRVSTKALINETMEMPETPIYMRPSFRDAINLAKQRQFDYQYRTPYDRYDPYEMDRYSHDEQRREEEIQRQISQIVDILNYGGEPQLGKLVQELFSIVKDMSRRQSKAESRAWSAERERNELRGHVDALRDSPTAVSLDAANADKVTRGREWCSKTGADVRIVDTAQQVIFMFADKTTASKFKLMCG